MIANFIALCSPDTNPPTLQIPTRYRASWT
jgi:hypothetical protein